MFMAGIAVFTVASAACGFAPSPGWLIGFRAVQGLGAAMLMPQTLTIITNTFPPERRGAAFGVWGAVAGVATIAGPTLGGLLVTAFDWRWIFFVNLPIGVLVLLLTPVIIPDLRLGPQAPDRHPRRAAGQRGAAGHLLRPGRGPEVQLGHDHRVHQHPAHPRPWACSCSWPSCWSSG